MPWIETIAYGDATGKLKTLYDRVKGPDDNVDNIMMMHSLRPHSMEGHMAIYKYVLHHSGNTIPRWFLEVLGVWVSSLNECNYCVEHHFSGMKRLLDDDPRVACLPARRFFGAALSCSALICSRTALRCLFSVIAAWVTRWSLSKAA